MYIFNGFKINLKNNNNNFKKKKKKKKAHSTFATQLFGCLDQPARLEKAHSTSIALSDCPMSQNSRGRPTHPALNY